MKEEEEEEERLEEPCERHCFFSFPCSRGSEGVEAWRDLDEVSQGEADVKEGGHGEGK